MAVEKGLVDSKIPSDVHTFKKYQEKDEKIQNLIANSKSYNINKEVDKEFLIYNNNIVLVPLLLEEQDLK